MPEDAQGGAPRRDHRHRPLATIPNQVNNVLCFPYIFRGALDVGATTINEAMKIACVHAIAELARRPSRPTSWPRAYGGETPAASAPTT